MCYKCGNEDDHNKEMDEELLINQPDYNEEFLFRGYK